MRINDENQKLEMEERDWNYIMPAYLRSYLFYTKNVPPAEVVFPMFKTVKYGEMIIPVRWVEPDSKEAVEVAADASNVAEATEAEIAQKDVEEKPPIVEQVEQLTKEVLDKHLEIDMSAARAAFAEATEAVPTDAEIQAEVEADAARDATLDEAEAEAKAAADAEAEAQAAQEAAEVTATTEVPTPPPAPNVPISEATQPAPQPPQPTPEPTAPTINTKAPPTDRPPKLPPVIIPPGQPLDGMHPRDKADQSRVAKDLKAQPDVDEGKEIEQDVSGLKE